MYSDAYPTLLSRLYISTTVPTPTLDLSVPSGPLYEGTSHTFTCTVTLPDTVDTDVAVDVQWTSVASSDRVMISSVTSMRSPFISTLTLSPLSISDAGQYSCEATADSSSQYITASNQRQSQLETVIVTGMPAVNLLHIKNIIYVFSAFSQLYLLLISLSHSLDTLLLVRTIPCSVQLVWWMVWWYCLT